jgi:hypothetical protein
MNNKTEGILRVPAEQSKIIWNHRHVMFKMDLDYEVRRRLHFWLWYIEGKRLSEFWLWVIYRAYRYKYFKDYYDIFRDSLVKILEENNGYETLHNLNYYEKCRDEFNNDPRNLHRDPKGYFAGIPWYGWMALFAFSYFLVWVLLN